MNHSQREVLEWATKSFGDVAMDPHERAARLVEEAVECAQAVGLPSQTITRIVARTYSRPPGDPKQEVGGMLITLEAFAEAAGVNMQEQGDIEWLRVKSRPPEWWEAKHAEKVRDGTADVREQKENRR